MKPMLKLSLCDNWKFRLSDCTDLTKIPNELISTLQNWNSATVPGTIHTDLLNNNIIDDPFYSDNELKIGWICESDWIYEKEFNLPKDYTTSLPVRLVFEGIDTVAEIFLNRIALGNVENMFRKYSFDITNVIKPFENILTIIFRSPLRIGKELETRYGKLPVALNSERVYLRKAQYSFGWDWGPSFPTIGIWKSIYIEQIPEIEITHLRFINIDADLKKAEAEVCISLSGNIDVVSKINITLENNDSRIVKEIVKPDENEINYKISLNDPKLWYPNGEGEQSLYNLKVEIFAADGSILDSKNRNVGIRKIDLILEEDGKNTFQFNVNGKPVFIKGVNWIPADSFLPRIAKDKYECLLNLVKEGNMNMVRVWGGGIYESDYFYELCDQLGLLVWQDFMFACGSYPEHAEFLENIKTEVNENISRLQYHPSIAIWCGNNENEWIWYQNSKTSYKRMPGYKIYHELIPSVIESLDPNRPYWPSSPFGIGDDPNYQGSGNNHQWNIWSNWIDYDTVVNDKSLFVTEFGFQGPANISTLDKVIPLKNRKTYDTIFEHHNKQVEGTERIFRFMATHLPVKSSWENFNYLAQLNQALALKKCVEHWRSRFPQTKGTIIWQMNDCWPVTSWSLVDSSLTPKIAYYIIKQTFAQSISIFVMSEFGIDVRLLNQQSKSFGGELVLKLFDLHTGKEISAIIIKVNSEPNSSATVHQFATINNNSIYVCYLNDEEGKQIYKNIFYSDQWKHAHLSQIQIEKKIIKNEDGVYLELESSNPVLFLDPYHPELTFSDRGFFLMPKEKVTLKIIGDGVEKVRSDEIKLFTLNDYLYD